MSFNVVFGLIGQYTIPVLKKKGLNNGYEHAGMALVVSKGIFTLSINPQTRIFASKNEFQRFDTQHAVSYKQRFDLQK